MCVWEDDLKQLQATFQTFEGDFITVQEFEVQSELTLFHLPRVRLKVMRSKSGQQCRQRSELSGGCSDVRGYWLSLWHDTKQKHIDALLQELMMWKELTMDGSGSKFRNGPLSCPLCYIWTSIKSSIIGNWVSLIFKER